MKLVNFSNLIADDKYFAVQDAYHLDQAYSVVRWTSEENAYQEIENDLDIDSYFSFYVDKDGNYVETKICGSAGPVKTRK